MLHTIELYKCPNCGETIDTFSVKCPACGSEIKGIKSSAAIREFTDQFIQLENDEQRILLIRNFPVPNTKEDIFEFLLLASSSMEMNFISDDFQKEMSKAWQIKLEQCYQKAKLLCGRDKDFEKMQAVYQEIQQKMNTAKKAQQKRRIFDILVKNIGVWCGIIMNLIAVWVDLSGGNSSILELIGCIILIVSACTLLKRKSYYIEAAISACSALLTISLSFLLENGSVLELCGGIVLLLDAIALFKNNRL